MAVLADCFLYNDEYELLKIRIQLLSNVVDRFVIVVAAETFTGRRKPVGLTPDSDISIKLGGRIRLITLDHLAGGSPWERESYSRNAISQGLRDLGDADLVLVSDVDEIPRPEVLAKLKRSGVPGDGMVLALDYFNFKFNYQLIHGPQAIWPGPVICTKSSMGSPQRMRDTRWEKLMRHDSVQRAAGWHFSFLARESSIERKLSSFSHQERSIQGRRDDPLSLINSRSGFHDHLHPLTVWAVVDLHSFRCPSLTALVRDHPELLLSEADDQAEVEQRIRWSVIKMLKTSERAKVLAWCSFSEVIGELRRRVVTKLEALAHRLKLRILRVIG